jgi:hypothetical protein
MNSRRIRSTGNKIDKQGKGIQKNMFKLNGRKDGR